MINKLKERYFNIEVNGYQIIGLVGKLMLDMRHIYEKTDAEGVCFSQKMMFCVFKAVKKEYLESNNKPVDYNNFLKNRKLSQLEQDVFSSQKYSKKTLVENIEWSYEKDKGQRIEEDYWSPFFIYNHEINIETIEKHSDKDEIFLYIDFLPVNKVSASSWVYKDKFDLHDSIAKEYIYNFYDIAGAYEFENWDDFLEDIEDYYSVKEFIFTIKAIEEACLNEISADKKDMEVFLSKLGGLVKSYAQTKTVDCKKIDKLRIMINEKYNGSEVWLLLIMLFESFSSTLENNKLIMQCVNCHTIIQYKEVKKYCSEDCRKSAQNKRSYERALRKRKLAH